MSEVEIAAKPKKQRWYRSLFVQVLIGIALGIATGILFPEFSHHLAPLGEGFIKLIKMVVAPLIFLVIVTGIAKVGSMKALGQIGAKALLWFMGATICALGLGLLVGNLVQPGSGLNIDPATLDTSALDEKTQGGHMPGGVEFVMHIIRPACSTRSPRTACSRCCCSRSSSASLSRPTASPPRRS